MLILIWATLTKTFTIILLFTFFSFQLKSMTPLGEQLEQGDLFIIKELKQVQKRHLRQCYFQV